MNQNQFGVNIWWHVPEVAVDADVVKEALATHGFSNQAMKEPSRRNEVSRAVRSLQDRRGKDDRRVAELTRDNGLTVTYGILDQDHVDDETVQFEQTTTIRLNKDTGAVAAEGVLADAVEKAVLHYEGKVTDEDVRSFLRKIVRRCRGVAKRPTGGIYFIPERFVGLIERAQGVLDDMRSGAHLYIEGVVNGERERKNVWEAVETDIESQLANTLHSVERIERSTKAVQGHQTKLLGLQEMMEVYTDLLGQEAEHESIAERISEAVKTVAHKMTTLKAGSAATIRRSPSGSKRGSKVYDAAVDVLTTSGSAMHYRDIMKAMVEAGSYDGASPTADRSVNDVIRRGIAKGDSRLKAVARGIYQVA